MEEQQEVLQLMTIQMKDLQASSEPPNLGDGKILAMVYKVGRHQQLQGEVY